MFYIYIIKNIINNKLYVGQTTNPERRWHQHKHHKKSSISIIHNAILKYGEENFTFTVIEEYLDANMAGEREESLIVLYNTRDNNYGYNIATGGKSFMLGRNHSDETKVKISNAFKGKVRPKETIDQIVQSRMEDQETQNKVIEAYKSGMTINEIKKTFGFGGNGKVYRILDKNNVERLNNFSKWTGRTHSKETKEKMTTSAEERWSSNDERARASEVGKNRNQNKLSTEQAKEVSIKYYEGKSIKDLSDEYNCSRQAICTSLKLMNTKMRSKGGKPILSIREEK